MVKINPSGDSIAAMAMVGLETLPRLTRTVFLLHRLDGLSYAEIGWRCGISVNEVVNRMGDALYKLHRFTKTRDTGFVGLRRAFRVTRDWIEAQKTRRRSRRLGIRDPGNRFHE